MADRTGAAAAREAFADAFDALERYLAAMKWADAFIIEAVHVHVRPRATAPPDPCVHIEVHFSAGKGASDGQP